MEKFNRSLALCGIAAAFCLGSCISVTDELDLDKKISLDVQVAPGGLSIPVGSLKEILIDSLIKVDGDNSELDILKDGLYGFHLIVCCVFSIGCEDSFHTAVDVDAPSNIVNTLDVGDLEITVLAVNTEDRGIGECENNNKYDEEHRFANSFHTVSSNMCSLCPGFDDG